MGLREKGSSKNAVFASKPGLSTMATKALA